MRSDLYCLIYLNVIFLGWGSGPVRAADVQSRLMTAVTKNMEGQVVYTEKHEIFLKPDGLPLKARTEYQMPDKKPRALLETNFSNGIAATDYTFTDQVDGSTHGVDIVPGGFLLWRKSAGKEREQKFIDQNLFKVEDLVVAGQGLHFYLRENFQAVLKKQKIPVKLLIPGRLDYYSFDLSVEELDEKIVGFKMRIHSFFLRLFADELYFKYEKGSRNLIRYAGPSNLVDQNGDLHSVEITYDPELVSQKVKN